MIAFIRGTVHAIQEDGLIIDVGGVGLMANAPVAMMNPRPLLNQEIFLNTYMHIREDNWQLFGFSTHEQLEIFKFLIGVSGVGAKTALTILNTITPSMIASAVANNDYNTFCTVPGVGKKTAQRLALELRDKIAKWASSDNSSPNIAIPTNNDAELIAALNQLGFGPSESRALSMQAVEKLGNNANTEDLLKEALRLAAKS